MLDAFFKGAGGGGGGFRGAKCKTLLKLSIPRIKLLRNRRELQLRQMRRDIAKLLEAGQEATARIRVRRRRGFDSSAHSEEEGWIKG
uniref:Uncharacterized protein n=1 Tax=Leersia perrieri TaxID=77586 RepID=A0A0D9X4X5_9ORYZ